jgi:ribosomal protein L19E
MTFADVDKIHAIGEEMDALKAQGKLTDEEWLRLYNEAKPHASRGDFLMPLIKRSPSGYSITVSE